MHPTPYQQLTCHTTCIAEVLVLSACLVHELAARCIWSTCEQMHLLGRMSFG